jgi:hypothetical protein
LWYTHHIGIPRVFFSIILKWMLFRFPQFLRPILRPLSIAQERKNIAMKNFKTPKIELNEQEERVCRLLVDVASHLRQHHQELPPVTLRIAGGWVRDKVGPN